MFGENWCDSLLYFNDADILYFWLSILVFELIHASAHSIFTFPSFDSIHTLLYIFRLGDMYVHHIFRFWRSNSLFFQKDQYFALNVALFVLSSRLSWEVSVSIFLNSWDWVISLFSSCISLSSYLPKKSHFNIYWLRFHRLVWYCIHRIYVSWLSICCRVNPAHILRTIGFIWRVDGSDGLFIGFPTFVVES